MTIWILASVLLASLAALGYRQGAIRVAFSFAGIVTAGLLAGTLGKFLKPVFPRVDINNPTLIWLLAPPVAFVILLILFKVVGFAVHRATELHYKYKTDDLRQALWERLNRRLGLCLGLLNGTAYLVLASLVIYNCSYWMVQIAPSDNEAKTVKIINQLGRDLESTGLDKAARTVDPMPDIYYRLADLVGLLCQNPALGDRLARYPAFLSMAERDEFQQLAQDSAFMNAWKQQKLPEQLWNDPQVRTILQNNDLINMIWEIIQTNLDDLVAYLKTGQSQTYGSEEFVGRWDFNVNSTLAAIQRARPNIPSAEMGRVRAWMTTAYAGTMFIAAPDRRAFLKNLPYLKMQQGQPPATEKLNFNGDWKEDGTNYTLSLTPIGAKGKSRSMKARIENGRLTISSGEEIFIFRRED
jgi:uncharacterized membrane protein required for colicin V production